MESEETPHHITKMDYPDQGLFGYYARVRRDDKRKGKMFSISKYGSWEEALKEAVAWRDDYLQQWERYCNGKSDVIQYQGTNTGFPGISVDHSKQRPRIIANLPTEEGEMESKSFALPEEDSDNFDKEFEEKFEQARRLVDENNRKRFGGRWYFYKKRKGLISKFN